MTDIPFQNDIFCDIGDSTNITANPWKFIECLQGPQMLDYTLAVTITIINVFVFISGLIGNVLVCIVIVKHPSLNSPTDFFLLNLALSDLALLIFGVPFDIMLYWYQYPWIFGVYACQGRALISEMVSYVSVLTVVTFSTERYLAICHPFHRFSFTQAQRCTKVIMVLWIISFICAIPFAIHSNVHYLTYPDTDEIIPESAVCGMISQPDQIPLTEISTIVFFIIPLILIIYQYANMGIVIHKATANNDRFGHTGTGSVHGHRRRTLPSQTIIKMLSFVVLGFFGCWFPFHAQRLSSIHLTEYPHFAHINYWLYIITGVFYYFSSTLNPILYNVMSERMRNAFREVLCASKPLQHVRLSNPRERTSNSYSDKPLVHQRDRLNPSQHLVEIGRQMIELNIVKTKLSDIE